MLRFSSQFLRNRASKFAQYTSEPPELTRKISSSTKARKINQRRIKMKKLGITFGTIVLLLGCVAVSRALQAASDTPQSAQFTQIDVPGAILTIANSINAGGDIVGPYFDGDGNAHGFLLSNGAFTTIDVPGAIFTIAASINTQGDIVGLYFDSSGNGHGYLLSNGGFTTIDVPGAIFTIANGINSGGDIVGDY